MKLKNRVAAITGGTAGIGRAIAEAFLLEGARVSVMARDNTRAARMLDDIGQPDRLIFVRGDATRQRDVEDFIDVTVANFDGIDILVNNAGGSVDLKPLVDLSDDAFDLAIRWNLYSTFWATRRALKTMLANSWGRVINISSLEGKHGKPVLAAYTAAKHAINGLTKSVAREVGARGVTVNAICPGLVLTDIVRETGPELARSMGLTFDELVQLFVSEAAIGRTNTLSEVAAVAVLLASDDGAGITGALYSVDGGSAHY